MYQKCRTINGLRWAERAKYTAVHVRACPVELFSHFRSVEKISNDHRILLLIAAERSFENET